jgi:hypothetical protein
MRSRGHQSKTHSVALKNPTGMTAAVPIAIPLALSCSLDLTLSGGRQQQFRETTLLHLGVRP